MLRRWKFHPVQVSSRSSKPAARGDERTRMTIIEVTQHHGGWEVSETIGTVHAYFPNKKEAVNYAKERLAFGPAELRFERNGAKRGGGTGVGDSDFFCKKELVTRRGLLRSGIAQSDFLNVGDP